jgi:hypothetical protein
LKDRYKIISKTTKESQKEKTFLLPPKAIETTNKTEDINGMKQVSIA